MGRVMSAKRREKTGQPPDCLTIIVATEQTRRNCTSVGQNMKDVQALVYTGIALLYMSKYLRYPFKDY